MAPREHENEERENEERENEKRENQKEDRRESGVPGGGAGRKDEVGRSGVYPASGPFPEGNAEIRGQASWGQGHRGAGAFEDHGSSELSYQDGQILGAYSPEHRAEQVLHVQIPADGAILHADLQVPARLQGAVLFAHGSGSSRHSPRNQFVAGELHKLGICTLLLDLLTEEEESVDQSTGQLRFDIGLLAGRLVHATRWLAGQREIEHVKLGFFGASTGAAAALQAAAEINEIAAVVSRGGRPDLAGDALGRVRAPVLLIVGGNDSTVLDLNRQAMEKLAGEKRLEVVPDATHLFEEPGALEQAATLAARWFQDHLGRRDLGIRAA